MVHQKTAGLTECTAHERGEKRDQYFNFKISRMSWNRCFHFFQLKFTIGNTCITVHHTRYLLVPSQVSYALKSAPFFVLTKHTNGVALNTVVNYNFRNALTLHYNFGGYFTSLINQISERWIYCFSTRSHRGSKLVQFECVLRALQCVLSALCVKVEVADINVDGRCTAFLLHTV